LGRYDGVLVDALRNSGVDAGRFARCAVCQAFFYKPRQRSRACSGQCENALKGREHYARMKRAQELKNQDKSLFEIARELGVKAGQVRKYLSAKEK